MIRSPRAHSEAPFGCDCGRLDNLQVGRLAQLMTQEVLGGQAPTIAPAPSDLPEARLIRRGVAAKIGAFVWSCLPGAKILALSCLLVGIVGGAMCWLDASWIHSQRQAIVDRCGPDVDLAAKTMTHIAAEIASDPTSFANDFEHAEERFGPVTTECAIDSLSADQRAQLAAALGQTIHDLESCGSRSLLRSARAPD